VRGDFRHGWETRHILITELAEKGAGDQTIMDIAGHVSRQMLSRYSHFCMEVKRGGLEADGHVFGRHSVLVFGILITFGLCVSLKAA
jgi:hypothetical protein